MRWAVLGCCSEYQGRGKVTYISPWMPAYQSLRSQNVACVHKRACNRTTESACGKMELPEALTLTEN